MEKLFVVLHKLFKMFFFKFSVGLILNLNLFAQHRLINLVKAVNL